MMPKLAIDFRSDESRLRLYYAAAVSLLGALASHLVAVSLLPTEDEGIGLFWCGAVALAPLVLYGWRALPAAALLALAVEALSRNRPEAVLIATFGDVAEAAVAYALTVRFSPFDPRFRTQADLRRFILFAVVVVPAISALLGLIGAVPQSGPPAGPQSELSPLRLWFGWATADATAILMTVPMALVWVTQVRVRGPRVTEIASLVIAAGWLLFMVGWLTPAQASWVSFLAILGLPLAFWAAIAFGRRSASLAALVIAVSLVGSARFGALPFAGFDAEIQHVVLAALLVAVLIGLLVIAIARSEQDRQQDQILESESRLRMMMESGRVVPYTKTAPDFLTYSFIGERAAAVFGRTIVDWGKPGAWLEFMHVDDRERMRRSAEEELPPEQDFEWEYRLTAPDGREIWVRDLFRVDHKVDGSLELRGVMMDVSTQKQRELALEESQLQLEMAKNQAEAANRAKSSFLTTVSHELRTPMNAVIGFADVLNGEAFGPLNSRQRDHVNDIAGSGRHLLRMINDILDMSKLESGRFALIEEVFDLGATLGRAVTHVSQETDGKDIAFATYMALGGASLYADPRAITQIVVNLMANAVKFTPSGGRIELKASASAEGLMLVVSDNGRGMSPETVERCFEPFYQGSDKNVSRKREGTGLGLAISLRMAEMHGGRLNLESRLGEGTSVTLWLPAGRLQWPDPSLRQG